MQTKHSNAGRMLAFLASFLIGGQAMAADFNVPQKLPLSMNFTSMPLVSVAAESADVRAPASPAMALGPAIAADTLGAMRGGDAIDNDVTLGGRVDNNTADRIVSGSNTIQDGAFANASGLSTVIQNTGSNVLIQNGTVVNVQFVAPGQ